MKFSDHILKPLATALLTQAPPPLQYPYPTLSKWLDRIKQSELIVVGGRVSSGKESFIDYTYVINVFRKWLETDEYERVPLHFYYFGFQEKSIRNKLVRWLSMYTMISDPARPILDAASLDPDSVAKTVDLRTNNKFLQKVKDAEAFFDELESHMTFISADVSPEQLYEEVANNVMQYGTGVGSEFEFKTKYVDMINLVIVDDDRGVQDKESSMYDASRAAYMLGTYLEQLKLHYKATVVLGHTSDKLFIRSPKDTEPTYFDTQPFYEVCDKALVVYNADAEGHVNFLDDDIESYTLGAIGTNVLRHILLCKGSTGYINRHVKAWYFPMTGVFREMPETGSKLYEKYCTVMDGYDR